MYKHKLRGSVVVGVSLAVLLGATGCLPAGEQSGAQRVDVGEPLMTASDSTAGEGLFPGFDVNSEVRIDSTPFAVGGSFIGSAFPRDGRSMLSFYGFDATGTTWRVDTNPTCVGTAPTQVRGEAAIVILDSSTRNDGQGVSITVATAFSAADGDVLWGPTEVPGPSSGTGLLFANTPKALTSERTPATLLDAASGAVVDESAGPALYEHHGTALEGTADNFSAIDSRSGETLWASAELSPDPFGVSPAASARYEGSYGPSTGGLVIVEWADPAGAVAPVSVIHDLRTGAPLGRVDGTPSGIAAVDDASQTVLFTSQYAEGGYVVTAARPGKGLLWAKEFASQAQVSTIGAGMVYAQVDGQAARIDLDSGTILTSGQYTLPMAMLPNGTALFPTDQAGTYTVATPRKMPAARQTGPSSVR
ncbi:PQQ-binding-like beta-propeller repeat protein [Arthrobacter cheniae]|nr:PQQ-binding-like beta-propeller repeat protein [Arthrobacter cheniae]